MGFVNDLFWDSTFVKGLFVSQAAGPSTSLPKSFPMNQSPA
jgi:hypothetical protein